jgi:hypothetical protein
MKTTIMKKTLRAAAVSAALCVAVLAGKTDAADKEPWETMNMWDNVYGKVCDDAKVNAVRVQHLGKLKVKYDSLKNSYLTNALGRDISNMNMNDLLLLRSGVYAVNGLLFKDENLYSRFVGKNSPLPWYTDYMCFLLETAYRKRGKGFVREEKDVLLSDAEKEFTARIDGRIAELRKNGMYVNKNGHTVGNTDHIVNMYRVKLDKSYMDRLTQNNFVIADLDTGHLQMFHLYEQNDYAVMPSFITTDLFLQAFHMYLSYTLKLLEEKKFVPALEDLTLGLYTAAMAHCKSKDGETAEIAEYNAAFYAVPYTLLTGKTLKVPTKYQKLYANEVKMSKDANQSGFRSEFLSYGYDDDFNDVIMHYNLHKPGGHYTRKPQMEAYFKAMMWLQKAYACRDKARQLKRNIFTASLLNTAKSSKGKPLIDVYASIFEPTALLVGESNNLSVMDIAQFLKNEDIKDLSIALSDEIVEKTDKMLTGIAGRVVIKPKLQTSCPDKINFMPQRYVIDAEVLQGLSDTSFNAPRAFPRGLDVFAALASAPANDVLDNFYKDKENWKQFPAELDKLQKKFNNFDGWNKSVYNKWIEALLALQKSDRNYPAFMNTKAWDYKNLNTSLASWAELKHDFILYMEEPYAAEWGDDGSVLHFLPKPDVEVGYVEPNILFWNKLDELVKLTGSTLAKHNLLDAGLKSRTAELQKFITFLIDVSEKELAKKPLTNEEYKTIKGIGGAVESFTLSVLDPKLDAKALKDAEGDKWNYITGPDRSIAVTANVYTRNMPPVEGKGNDLANGTLYVATGKANEIYVVVEINGYLYLTRGATFSYYEFVVPEKTSPLPQDSRWTTPRFFDRNWKSGRLTDKDWQKTEADKSKRPPVQEWMKTVIEDKKPLPKIVDGWKSENGPLCFVEGDFICEP